MKKLLLMFALVAVTTGANAQELIVDFEDEANKAIFDEQQKRSQRVLDRAKVRHRELASGKKNKGKTKKGKEIVVRNVAKEIQAEKQYSQNNIYRDDWGAYGQKYPYHSENPIIYVNKDITTHIVLPENIKLVDISTKRVIGNRCADNILRIKPAENSEFTDSLGEKKWHQATPFRTGDIVGTVTIIGERYIAQYEIVYTSNPRNAHSLYNVPYTELQNYTNKEVDMTREEMAHYAWAIWKSKKKYYKINANAYGMHAQINNIYTVDGYFFIDFSLYNKTNIRYDINEIRVKLTDKRQTKSTNVQTVELTPEYALNSVTSFKRGYRNIIVIKKLTFPDEKILRLEISEDQISGRVISIPIEYTDILHADSFDRILMRD